MQPCGQRPHEARTGEELDYWQWFAGLELRIDQLVFMDECFVDLRTMNRRTAWSVRYA